MGATSCGVVRVVCCEPTGARVWRAPLGERKDLDARIHESVDNIGLYLRRTVPGLHQIERVPKYRCSLPLRTGSGKMSKDPGVPWSACACTPGAQVTPRSTGCAVAVVGRPELRAAPSRRETRNLGEARHALVHQGSGAPRACAPGSAGSSSARGASAARPAAFEPLRPAWSPPAGASGAPAGDASRTARALRPHAAWRSRRGARERAACGRVRARLSRAAPPWRHAAGARARRPADG